MVGILGLIFIFLCFVQVDSGFEYTKPPTQNSVPKFRIPDFFVLLCRFHFSLYYKDFSRIFPTVQAKIVNISEKAERSFFKIVIMRINYVNNIMYTQGTNPTFCVFAFRCHFM